MRRVLVTGASGFIGMALCEHLSRRGFQVRAALRANTTAVPPNVECCRIGELGTFNDWTQALEGVELVVHAAGLAHQERVPPQRYLDINAHASHELAAAAASAGVRRLVFLSTLKVHGSRSPDRAFRPTDAPRPEDPYAQSKLRAEQLLQEVAAQRGLEVAIVRPPLVYGSGVRANFLRLLRWVDRGYPLPFGLVHNRRSLVSVWNLVSLIESLLTHPQAPRRAWLVSDDCDLSTVQLVQRLAQALRRPYRLLPVPMPVLRLGAALLGRAEEMARLCDSLTADISATRTLLEWAPPLDVEQGLARTAQWFHAAAQ